MKTRKFLSLALALILCSGLLTVSAGAYDMGKVGERAIISAGAMHTAAIDASGSLWMWGGNAYGGLGNGGTMESTVPIKVLDDVSTVSCGGFHTAAVKTDGSLWMWGGNGWGQLGNGTTRGATKPIKVLDDVAAVSCGNYYTAAIQTDGSLWMWGSNTGGQLGNGGAGNSTHENGWTIQTVPIKVMDGVTAVSCGSGGHVAAVKVDGSLWMWGSNGDGELGNGGTMDSTVPIKVLDNVTTVSCGSSHTAAIKADGSLWMWGKNDRGQLGNGTAQGAAAPVKVLDHVAAVSCGNYHTAAIDENGALWTWGFNGSGQLGNDGGRNGTYLGINIFDSQTAVLPIQTVPVKVMGDVAAVSGGDYYTVAVKADGSLWTWGYNCKGQLGYEEGNSEFESGFIPGPVYYQTVPRQVAGITTSKAVRIYLNGGVGGGTLWTNAAGTIQVPTNPTKEGFTFGGWYIDEGLTTPWNFNDAVVDGLVLYAKWNPVSSTAATVGQSGQRVTLNGSPVDIQGYTLIAENGGDVTYVKLRDVAALLDGTSAQFNVDWRGGAIYVDVGQAYTTRNGTELKAISGTDGSYRWNTAPVLFGGETKALEGIVITDGDGGGHTFFKLRDLGAAIGFTVDWDAQRGIYIETN